MAISIAANFIAQQTSAGTSVTSSSGTPNANDTCIVGISSNSVVTSVVDSLNNVWRVKGPYGPNAGGRYLSIAYLPGDRVVNTARTVTATQAVSGKITIGGIAVTGLARHYPFDSVQWDVGGAGTAQDSRALDTPRRYPNSLLIGLGSNNTSTTMTWTAGTNYSLNASASTGAATTGSTLGFETQIVSVIGSDSAPLTSSVSSNWTQLVAVFADTDVPGASWGERITRHPGRSPGMAGVSARFWQPATARNAIPGLRVGDAASTQADETGSAAGTVKVQGVATLTQAAETGTAAGSVKVTGTAAQTQADETGSAAGTAAQPPATTTVVGTGEGYFPPVRRRRPLAAARADGWAYQADQIGLATGTTRAHARQEDQKSAGAGRVLVLGKCSTGNAPSNGRASGRLLIKGAANICQRPAWPYATGKVMARGWGHVKGSDARAFGAGTVDWSGANAREDDALARGSWMLDLFEE